MWYQPKWNGAGPFVGAILAAATAMLPLAPARGADLEKAAPSLQWVPEDAAFYSAMLRNREQLNLVLNSKAWAKLKALPVVQALWEKAKGHLDQEDSPAGPVRKFFEDPQNRQLVELLGDMFGDEVFSYGGASTAEFFAFLMQFNNSVSYRQMIYAVKKPGSDPNELYLKAFLDFLADHPNFKAPETVLGFRLTDTKRAEEQLKRLEPLAQALIAQVPQLQGRLKTTKVGPDSYLTLTLDGKMIPWDDVPVKDVEDKPGQYDKVVKRLTDLKLTISLGLHGKYLLLSTGESTDHLAALGKAKNGLAGRPEFKPLARFADQRVTSISYASKAFSGQFVTKPSDINNMVKLANELVPMADLPERQRKQLDKDINDLVRDLKKFLPDPGAASSVSFMTAKGTESYSYSWGKNPVLDSSKPLPLLNHVGGDPLVAVVYRYKVDPANFEVVAKWAGVFTRYWEELGVPRLNESQREQYQKFAKAFFPIFRKYYEVSRDLMYPALKDGQSAFVLDGKLTSKQWFKMLPPSDKPLPLLEPAFVVGVSDPDMLREAMAEYRALANEALAKARELVGDEFPELQIPAPETRQTKKGTFFVYPLPDGAPVDNKIRIAFGLGPKVGVVAISQDHAERLLAETPFKPAGGPLADRTRPLAVGTYFDTAGLMGVLSPWVEMGVRMVEPFIRLAAGDAAGKEELAGQVKTVFDVLKVFGHTTAATRLEDGVWVTHSETVYQDL